MHKRKALIFTLILILIMAAANLVIGEVVMRIYEWSKGRGQPAWIPDDYLGRIHRANSRFIYWEEFSQEFETNHRTNAFGLIGESIDLHKSPDTVRLLILGDSFTEGLQVDGDKSFCSLLHQSLNQKNIYDGKSVEVLNGGMSSASPIYEYFYFKRELAKLKPDIVVLQLFANDVFEDHKVAAMSVLDEEGLPLKISRYFTAESFDESLPARLTNKKDWWGYSTKRWLLTHSRFCRYLYRFAAGRAKKGRRHQQITSQQEYEDGNQFFIIQDDHPLFQDAAFRNASVEASLQYIEAIKDLSEEIGATFLMFYIPPEAQVHTNRQRMNVQAYFEENQPNQYWNTVLYQFSQRHAVPYLDLLTIFRQEGDVESLYYARDGHINEKGHQLVAQSLYTFLAESAQ